MFSGPKLLFLHCFHKCTLCTLTVKYILFKPKIMVTKLLLRHDIDRGKGCQSCVSLSWAKRTNICKHTYTHTHTLNNIVSSK